ncbi:MAG: hypothetical protein J6A03_08090 [Lachnospiraceae bacterium]|nr:hypothetical protein [Lachnospiraceae bacterium]
MKKNIVYWMFFIFCICCWEPICAKAYEKKECNVYIGEKYYIEFSQQGITYKLNKKNVATIIKQKNKIILKGKKEGRTIARFYLNGKLIKKINIKVTKNVLPEKIELNLNEKKYLKFKGKAKGKRSKIVSWHKNTVRKSLKKSNQIFLSVKNPRMIFVDQIAKNIMMIKPKRIGTTKIKMLINGKKYISNIKIYPSANLSFNN